MSDEATQQISYNCLNSVGFYNEKNMTYDHAVRLLSSDENVLTADKDSRLSYRVLEDSCKVSFLFNIDQ